jgi:hypothetical protein
MTSYPGSRLQNEIRSIRSIVAHGLSTSKSLVSKLRKCSHGFSRNLAVHVGKKQDHVVSLWKRINVIETTNQFW